MMNRVWLRLESLLKNLQQHSTATIVGVASTVAAIVVFKDNLCQLLPPNTLCDSASCRGIRSKVVKTGSQKEWESNTLTNINNKDSASEPKIEIEEQEELWLHFAAQPNNKKLVLHLNNLISNQPIASEKSTVTFVLGSAGVGKTFFLRNFWKKNSDQVYRIQLSEIPEQEIEEVPDLQIESSESLDPLSSLPAIKNLDALSIERLFKMFKYNLNNRKHKILIIDDLDEVSQETADTILEEVIEYKNKFLKESSTNLNKIPLHFVVIGRPEAFAPKLRDDKVKNLQSPSILTIQGPEYSSSEEIKVFYENYIRNQVPQSLKLLAKQKQDDVIDFISKSDNLKSSLQLLELGNHIFESILKQLNNNPDTSKISDKKIKEDLLDALERRAKNKHSRPSQTEPYRHLIEDIAASKWTEVNQKGYFSVNVSDVVDVKIGEKSGQVKIEHALDRSGVATLNPADATTREYKFEPAWVHRYYTDKHNERIKKELKNNKCYVPSYIR